MRHWVFLPTPNWKDDDVDRDVDDDDDDDDWL